MEKVSVIIPSYNHSKYIEETIRSVFSQDYTNKEVIIIDDGSKDNSPTILKKMSEEFSFDLILKENEGLCKTLNLGLERASGELILIIASDDSLTPGRISEQVAFFTKDPELAVVSGAINLIDNDGKYLFSKTSSKNGYIKFDDLISRNFILAPTCMIRKSVYEKVGKYREDYLYEDYYLWLKLLSKGYKILVTSNVWANYRFMSGSMNSRLDLYYKGLKQILSDYLPNPKVESALYRARLIYFIKKAFYEDKPSFDQEEFKFLKKRDRLFVKLFTLIPSSILKYIHQKVLARV